MTTEELLLIGLFTVNGLLAQYVWMRFTSRSVR